MVPQATSRSAKTDMFSLGVLLLGLTMAWAEGAAQREGVGVYVYSG